MDQQAGSTPSTRWQEVIAPGEDALYTGYARQFAELQQRKSAQYGRGRALHRKQLLACQAELEVLDGLPDFARQGLFAQPGHYAAQVRLSNGGMDRASDKTPDIRGFSLAVLGVQGDSALGIGPATRQCFALINQTQFGFPKSGEFVDFVVAASHGKGALLKYLVRRYGVFQGLGRLVRLARSFGKPFSSYATERFYSAAPIACGPYAVRVQLVPEAGNGEPPAQAPADWGADMAARLQQGPLTYLLGLQPFVDERTTPIEDASVNWPTPYTPVARLTLPRQDLNSAQAQALTEAVEAAVFDPWAALAAHRPLGDVMRARKVVYFESQKGRAAQA